MWTADNWFEYKLIDSGDGERLERWGKYVFVRPDPQAVWPKTLSAKRWESADYVYHRSNKGGGSWEERNYVPESFHISQDKYTFKIKPMGFKHMGLFPEQLVNWMWADKLIREAGRDIKVLNLFAYTGGATVAAAKAGASVCHVDASKGMVAHAKENAALSGLADHPIRYIVDDCVKFVEREIRRGNKYDAIIMDPPSYGRGPKGEIWKIEDEIFEFVKKCCEIMSDNPLFMLINSYTTGLSGATVENILKICFNGKGKTSCDEIGLPCESNGLILPCGCSARWENK